MTSVSVVKIPVEPRELIVLECTKYLTSPREIALYPTYYDCIIRLSPLIVKEMLEWLIKEHYVKIKGTVCFTVNHRKVKAGGEQ